MDTVTHDGRTTAYRAPGTDEPTVLYIHGSGGTHRVWVNQYAPDGPAPGVALDLAGHGESDDIDTPAGPETLDAYADDVCAVARETGATVLCGNSLGGAVAMHVALERDLAIDGLVLCGTGAKLGVGQPLLDALADDFEGAVSMIHQPGMLFADAPEDVVEKSAEMLRTTGRAVTERDFRTCDAFDVRDRLEEIAVPTLAITGADDGLTPPSFHEYLVEGIPDATLELVDDAAHLSMLERPDAWNRAVEAFLDGR
ncbi:alpha/beta fold hydrolase [Natronomonas sp. EA1]|uniref:alpha/beta fold hydrolase n=1 Tax=Natronomonas sp. EA1 TaxID=3421655 RepID=UPI003EBE5758